MSVDFAASSVHISSRPNLHFVLVIFQKIRLSFIRKPQWKRGRRDRTFSSDFQHQFKCAPTLFFSSSEVNSQEECLLLAFCLSSSRDLEAGCRVNRGVTARLSVKLNRPLSPSAKVCQTETVNAVKRTDTALNPFIHHYGYIPLIRADHRWGSQTRRVEEPSSFSEQDRNEPEVNQIYDESDSPVRLKLGKTNENLKTFCPRFSAHVSISQRTDSSEQKY